MTEISQASAFALLDVPSPEEGQAWFDAIAALLLGQSTLMVQGQPHKLLEIEFYYHSEAHPDPFAHGDEIQRARARWYFHRDSGEYRGGSFKGLDISFGPEGIVGGVLIRTLQAPNGDVINGCSLCVDHILAQTGFGHVRDLDAAIAARHVWQSGGPLELVYTPSEQPKPIYATARVGLTLKRAYQFKLMPAYIMRPYRYVSDPQIKKGKLHTVIALHKAGNDAATIKRLTGTNQGALDKYTKAFDEGAALENFNIFRGKALSTDDLCKLHGAWHKHFGE